jgi:hypothetical protein
MGNKHIQNWREKKTYVKWEKGFVNNIRIMTSCNQLACHSISTCRPFFPICVPPSHKHHNDKTFGFSCSPGTIGCFGLRLCQLFFAFLAFIIMVKVPKYQSVTAFWYDFLIFHMYCNQEKIDMSMICIAFKQLCLSLPKWVVFSKK